MAPIYPDPSKNVDITKAIASGGLTIDGATPSSTPVTPPPASTPVPSTYYPRSTSTKPATTPVTPSPTTPTGTAIYSNGTPTPSGAGDQPVSYRDAYGKDTPVSTPPASTTATTGATTPDRMVRTPGVYDASITTSTNALNDYLNNAPQPRTLEQIKEQKAKEAQAQADLITSSFNTALASETAAGAERTARTRAVNVASGLGGSDFASAAAEKTDAGNRKNIDLLTSEKNAKIAAALAGIDDRASEQYQKERAQNIADLTGRIDLQTKLRDQERAKANDSIKGLAGSGVSLDSLKTKEPQAYQTLLTEYGGSALDLETAYNEALPENMKVKYEQQITQGPDGNAVILRYGVNPLTGTIDKKEYDLGVNYNVLKGVKPIQAGGVLYAQQPDGTLKPLTPAVNAKKVVLKSGGLELTGEQLAAGEKKLQDSKGPDNFVNSEVYKAAYDDWVDHKGLAKDFLAKWPPNEYTNPNDMSLPQYLRATAKAKPKTASGRTA